MTADKTFGEQVRALRDVADMTQKELAQAADISPDYVSRIERGEYVPAIDALWKICRALDAGIEEVEALFVAAGGDQRDFWFDIVDRVAARPHARVPLEYLIEASADLDSIAKASLLEVFYGLKERSDIRRSPSWSRETDYERRQQQSREA